MTVTEQSPESPETTEEAATETPVAAPEAPKKTTRKVAAKKTTPALHEDAVEVPESPAVDGLGVEDFIVVHPRMSVYVGILKDDPEDDNPTLTLPSGKVVEVIDGHAVFTQGQRLRPTSDAELADFRQKVQLGFLTPVPAAVS